MTLRTRFYRETRDLRYDLAQKRLEMRRLFADPKADQASLLAKQKELSVLWQRLSDIAGWAVIEARAVLSLDQVERLEQLPLS